MTWLRTPAVGARSALFAFGLGLGALLLSGQAQARAGGIASSSCLGCHGGGVDGTLSMTAAPASFAPGATVELTISLAGGYTNGGVYVNAGNVGELQAIANQGLTKVSSGLVHNQPKPASAGAVQFRFNWSAPAAPGAVRFSVYALGGNGNGAAPATPGSKAPSTSCSGARARRSIWTATATASGGPIFPCSAAATLHPWRTCPRWATATTTARPCSPAPPSCAT